MNQIKFLVQGSVEEPYQVIFFKDAEHLYASCDCKAGSYGRYCKHRIHILNDEKVDIVSDNLDDVATVQSWLYGTELESVFKSVQEAEDVVSEAQRRLSLAKRSLARIMTPP